MVDSQQTYNTFSADLQLFWFCDIFRKISRLLAHFPLILLTSFNNFWEISEKTYLNGDLVLFFVQIFQEIHFVYVKFVPPRRSKVYRLNGQRCLKTLCHFSRSHHVSIGSFLLTAFAWKGAPEMHAQKKNSWKHRELKLVSCEKSLSLGTIEFALVQT